ncbi:MAG: hypothetical protein QM645_06715 [Asticcacaulis sp.]
MKFTQRFLAFIGLCLLAACDAGPSAVLPDGQGAAPTEQTTPAPQIERAATPQAAPPPVDATTAPANEDIKITRTRYGDWPLWSSNRQYTAYENATYHYEKHGHAFAAQSYEHWLSLVHEFIHNPPKGTETLMRNNGDTLFYNRSQNVFAVMTKAGAPRTMFRPDNGANYWQRQKQIESERRTIRED